MELGKGRQPLEHAQEIVGADRTDRPVVRERAESEQRLVAFLMVANEEQRSRAVAMAFAPEPAKALLVDLAHASDLDAREHAALQDAVSRQRNGA